MGATLVQPQPGPVPYIQAPTLHRRPTLATANCAAAAPVPGSSTHTQQCLDCDRGNPDLPLNASAKCYTVLPARHGPGCRYPRRQSNPVVTTHTNAATRKTLLELPFCKGVCRGGGACAQACPHRMTLDKNGPQYLVM